MISKSSFLRRAIELFRAAAGLRVDGSSSRQISRITIGLCFGASLCLAQPSISSFTASPTSINPGTVTRLSWSATGAASILVDSVGDTNGQNLSDVTGQNFIYEAPTQTTTYTLTASNGPNSATKQVTVTVTDTAPPQFGTGTTYYVSPSGNDGNNGLSPAAPWQTVAKVNASSFNPGDIILFQRGGEWHESLTVPSNGAPGNPITFADYGSGAKPKFWGSVVLNNASFHSLGNGLYSYTIATPVLSALVNHVFFYYNASNNAANLANSWSYSGTTLLINSPNSNPITNGNVYTAVVRQDVVFTNYHSHLIFRNLVVDESAAFNGGYSFRVENSTDVLLDSCEAYRAGKHHYGAINSTQFVGKNLYAAWAMPGQGYGGASAYVTFGDATEVPLLPNQTSVWQNCVFDHPQDPQEGFNYYAIFMHGPNVTSVTLNNLSSLGGNVGISNGDNPSETISITGGLIENARMEIYGQGAVVDGLHITGPIGQIAMYGSHLTFQNLILEGSYLETDGYATALLVQGNANTVRFSTIVLDSRAAGNYSCVTFDNNSSTQRVGGTFFTYYGNICISPVTNLKQWDAGTPISSDISLAQFNLYSPSTIFGQINSNSSYNSLTLSQWQALGVDAGSILANPLFQDQVNENYNLLQASLAVDGVPLPTSLLTAIPPIPVDFAGNPRLEGGAFDMGALESPFAALPSVHVTVQTSPPGLPYTLDNAITYTTSQTLTWVVGSSHTITTVSSQPGSTGTQYGFANWSDGGALSHSVTVPAANVTYTANFNTQYFLSASASPAGSGSVTGGGAFYNSGSNVPVTATPVANFSFANWTGNVASPTAASTTVAMNAPQSVTANFSLSNLPPGYQHYRAITINHAQVSGASNLTNFPVLVSLAADSDLATFAQASGNDILFTDSTGANKLNHEIETFAPANGQLIAWVQVPSISPTSDTVLYMFYGNASATNQQSKTAVWDSNYQGVWHLPNGTALTASDSTSNANNGTNSNAAAASGKIDGAAGFNGSTASLDFGSSAGLRITGPVTAEAWINLAAWPANGFPFGILGMGYSYATQRTGWMLEASTDNSGNRYLNWFSNNGSTHGVVTSVPSLAAGTWHHLAGSFDGATWRMYLDGAANGSSTDGAAPVNTGNDVVAGGLSTNGFGNIFLFNGLLDELRVSNIARSAAWIATEYNNQSSPVNFLSIGAAHNGGGGGGGTVPITVTSSPSGLAFQVDGTTYTTAQTFQWTAGASHTIAVTTSPQAGVTGVQSLYASWSDGGAQSHAITVPASAASYTANFTTQYFLTTSAGAGGTISPASGWVNTGASVSISATANSGYQFSGFTGAVTGTTNPSNLTVNAPASVTANFTSLGGGTLPITVTSSPSGLTFQVDGTSYTTAQTFQWTAGASHTIAVTTSPQAGATGVQNLYTSWSDGGAQSHSITVPASAATYTANLTTQYFLTTSAGTGGTITPASAWVNGGTSVSIGATANSGYQFSGFSGAVTGTTAPVNLTVNAPASVTANFTPSSGGGSNWYNNAWGYQQAITINHAQVSGAASLTNFPVLISLPTDPSLAANAQSNGNDILFTDSSGTTKLNHEIETYNPATGRLVAWVQVPSVSPITDTVIYMFFGNPSATSQQSKTAVWDTNYQGVWHLPNGTALSALDSTVNAGNGTISNAIAINGEIDGGASFNGSAAVDFGSATGLRITGPITAEAWINVSGWPANGYPSGVFGMGYSYATQRTGWVLETSTDSSGRHYLNWFTNNGSTHGVVTAVPSLATGAWHHLVGTFDGAAWRMYLDGAANGSSTDATAPSNTGDDIVAGGLSTNGFGNIFPFSGLLDELRVSNIARSAGWIATEYNNQSNPANFLSVGAVQSGGGGGGGGGTVAITVTSAPTGLAFQVDGTTYTALQTFQWNPGDAHTIAVTTSPQPGTTGVQSVYTSWSDAGAQSHAITVPASSASFTANFTTQYFLTTSAGTGGTITPASTWVNGGTSISISATAASGYQFAGFSGAVSGTTNPVNFTVNAPAAITANFASSGGGVTIATSQYDNNRTGANTQETVLTPANVAATGFGLIGSFTGLDEFVYAQPLYIPGVIVNGAPHTCLIVATMNNTVYCFDAKAPGTAPLWSTHFEAPSTNSAPAFYNRVIGCVATPVADIPNNLVYLTCANSSNNWVLRAVNLSTGAVVRSITIAGQVPGTGDPAGDHLSGPNLLFWGPAELQRPGLLLLNGTIYMGFGGTGGGDIHPWHGWIMGYNAANFNQTSIICLTPNSYGSAIWQSGGGLVSDGTYIYVTTGNDNSGPYTESFLKLDQSLNIVDYFTPSNFGNLDAADLDLTSGKLMIIPGTTYVTGGGKDYRVWLLNTADMGHVQGTGTAPQVFYTNPSGPQGSGIYGGMFMNNVGYFPNSKGSIYAFPFASPLYNTTPTKTSASYAFPGADMSGSANGAANGIIWAMTPLNSAGREPQIGTLRAFDASSLVELWNSDQHSGDTLGGFAKFVIPIVADGRVYAANSSGSIQVYGLTSGSGAVSTTVTTSPFGLSFTVDGTTYTTAQTFQWTPGTPHTIAVTTSPQAGATGVQSLYASWSDGGAQSHTITAPSTSTTYTANFTTQYFLTTSAGTGGTISPASGWVNGGTSVSLSATANSGYQFSSFSGSVTGTTNPVNFTVHAPATVTANFSSASSGSNWYNNAWGYQQAITINHAQVSGASNLTNFPVLISLPTDASLAAHAQSSGNDIVFTDSSGTTKLNHEIETYNSTTGQLVAWVQLPSLSPTSDTVIYMYFGNPSATSQQSKTAVWDTNYQGVWHLPNGTALSALDSTVNAGNGTISNAIAINGEIDGGASFNGSAAVDFGSATGLRITGPITAEAWINVSGWPANGYPSGVFGMGYSYATQRTGWVLETSTDSSGRHYLNWFTNNGSTHGVVTAVPSLATGAWHHLVGTYDGAAWRMYLDGAANGSSTDATAPSNTGDDIVAGGLSTNGFGNIFPFSGVLDELRVSNIARSAGWIATEYNNQSNPANFLSVGALQTGGGGGGGTVPITVTSAPSGLAFQVDGTTYTAAQTFQWTAAATHTIAVTTSPQAGATGVQNLYASWSDGGGQSHTITVPASSASYTANFTTQYFLTTSAGTGGTISPPSGWMNAGTSVSISASAASGYQFAGFTGAVSGTTTPVNFAVNAPASVAASFTPTGGGTVSFTVNSSPPGLGFQVDGSAYSTAQTFQWTPGDSHTIAITTSPQAGATGVQNVYASWSDGGAQSHTITVPASTTTYTANFTTQYFLTTSAGTGGTISPASGWVNGGTSVSISATVNNGYQFSGFTGAATGTTNPVNLTVNAPASVTANFTVSSGGGSNWYNNAWAYQQPITINHALVSGGSGLANFPVLISMATNASLAAHAQSNGNDIVFTDSSGTNKLNHEIETYNSTTGQLIAWVQIPSLSPTADTVVYMYFGNPSASTQQSKTAVWDANFKGVWHLPNGATLNASDSTANAGNGTISNAAAASGEIDGAASFNGTASVDLGSGAGLHITGPITAEAWINVAAWPANGYPSGILGMGYSYASQWTGWMLEAGTDNGGNHYLSWFSNNGSMHGVQTAASSLSTGSWHHMAGTFDGATWRMYLDGAPNGSSADATAPLNTGDDIAAGGLSTNGYGTIFPFKGLLDELRVSNAARSAGWIATEYNNQSNPANFLSVGTVNAQP